MTMSKFAKGIARVPLSIIGLIFAPGAMVSATVLITGQRLQWLMTGTGKPEKLSFVEALVVIFWHAPANFFLMIATADLKAKMPSRNPRIEAWFNS